MPVAVPERRYTPEELLALPDGEQFELVDGQLVEKHTGAASSWTAGKLSRLLGNFGEERGLGRVFPPDLAVEVVSPNDFFTEVRVKVGEYLEAGVRLVWVIDPLTRTVEIHRADGSRTFLEEGGLLDREDVLPGFTCSLPQLFGAG